MEGGEHEAVQQADVQLASRWKALLPIIVLVAILVLGWNLRAFHIGYPVVGYHNWKETHYLTEARNFAREGFFAHGFFVPAWDYPFPSEDLSGAHADTFPTISVLGAFAIDLFGENLAVLRGISIVINLASIIFIYLIVRLLFKREDLALTTAFLAALCPLLVFFSRNFQLDSPAMFLMLAGTWFLLRWIEHDKPRDIILASLFVTFGIMTKYSFAVMALPYFAIFPYRRLSAWKERLKSYLPAAGIGLLLPLWFFYMESYFKGKIKALYGTTGGGAVISLTEIINFKEAFTAGFVQTMRSFIADNFTIVGFWFAVAGLVLLLVMRKKHPLGARFFLAYAGFGLLAMIILAHKLGGHSYHQFPYAPLMVFLIAYAFIVIAATVGSLVRIMHVRWAVIALLAALLWAPSMQALDRQFGTQFPGLDVAGEFIRANSEPWERVLHSSHQNYGVLWHADRKGYKIPDELAAFKDAEEKGARWLFVYQWRFNLFQNENVMPYIRQNYGLRQVGFVMQGTQFAPYYFLLQRGGTFNESQLNNYLSGQPLATRQYELPGGILVFNILSVPPQEPPRTVVLQPIDAEDAPAGQPVTTER